MAPRREERQMKGNGAHADGPATTPFPREAGSKAVQPMLRDAETSMNGTHDGRCGFLPPRRTP